LRLNVGDKFVYHSCQNTDRINREIYRHR